MYFNSHQNLPSLFFVVLCASYIFEDDTAYSVAQEPFLPLEFTGSHQIIVNRYFAKRKDWNTSNLGTILFKNEPPEKFRHKSRERRTYVVLLWSNIRSHELRHKEYYKKRRINPLEFCSVKNCIFTQNTTLIGEVDVVIFTATYDGFPEVNYRNPKQKWVVWTQENPMYMTPAKPEIFASLANWTMTYRTEADVPVPYGRIVPLPQPMMTEEQFKKASLAGIVPHWSFKRHDVLATVLLNQTVPTREKYMKDLLKYLKFDVYGGIATNKSIQNICPLENIDCEPTFQYLFYLAFENLGCRQYITEKTYYHSFYHGAIPVIMGPSLKDCEELLPPKSFIHVDQFASVKELARHIKKVASNKFALLEYHRWRNHFEAANEHGLFDMLSLNWCRLCEALNYNEDSDKSRIYNEDEIEHFFDINKNCNVESDNHRLRSGGDL